LVYLSFLKYLAICQLIACKNTEKLCNGKEIYDKK
jgi:hypothetical protein